MADAELVFNNCTLDIIVPDSLIQLPTEDDSFTVDDWLEKAREPGERKQAFFGAYCLPSFDYSGSYLIYSLIHLRR